LLLTNGANVNAKNNEGDTPLIVAVLKRHESIVRLLLEHGADINIKNKNDSTALSIAIDKNYLNIIELFSKSTNTPFVASSVTPNIRVPPTAGSSLASIHEAGIKAMRDRFKNHYNVIVYNDPATCLIKGPQQIKQMYKSSVAGPILLKRLESKRLGPAVAAGLQSKNMQQLRLNTRQGYSKDTAGGNLPQELAVNNLLFRIFNLPFRAVWLVTALASKAPIHAIGLNMKHITGKTLFGRHATGFLKCKDQWYYYNDNKGLFKVSSGFIDALQTALNFNDGQIHPSICIKTIEDNCYLLSLNNVNTTYKYSTYRFSNIQYIGGPVTPNQIWTESGWVPFQKWKGANISEATKIETTVINKNNEEPSYYNVLYVAYCIVKYGPEYEDALFRSAIITQDISYIDIVDVNTIDPNMIVDPTTNTTILMWTAKNLTSISLLLKLLYNPKTNLNLQDIDGMTALMYLIQYDNIKILIKNFIENPRIDLTIKTKGNLLGFGKKSALDFANQTKDPEIIKLIQDAMARPKPTPPSSSTRKRSFRWQKRTRKLRNLKN
jgi:ankyrin repeat protein